MAKVTLELEAETLQLIGNCISHSAAMLNQERDIAITFHLGLSALLRENPQKGHDLNDAMDQICAILLKAGISTVTIGNPIDPSLH